MNSTLDILDDLYGIIGTTVSEGTLSLTGDIYKTFRPAFSDKEDIVINSLPISGTQVQRCTLNVNCYVPDILLLIDGQEQYMPDHARLKTIGGAIMAALETTVIADGIAWVDWQTVLREPEINQHFVNIRIEYHGH